MTLKDDAKFKGKLKLKKKFSNTHFDRLLLSKAYKDLDEKVQKSYVSWHWRVMQSLKYEQRQVWKFALCCPTFVKSVLCLSPKSTEELCVIKPKNDAKFEEELTCALKNVNGEFWLNSQKSQNLHFNGLLLTKVYNV